MSAIDLSLFRDDDADEIRDAFELTVRDERRRKAALVFPGQTRGD